MKKIAVAAALLINFSGFVQAEGHTMATTFRSSKAFLVFYVLLLSLLVAESSRGANKAIRAVDRRIDGKSPCYGPSFWEAEEIRKTDIVKANGLENYSIYVMDYHLIYLLLKNSVPLTAASHPSAIFKPFFLESYDEIAQHGGLMRYIDFSVVLNEAG